MDSNVFFLILRSNKFICINSSPNRLEEFPCVKGGEFRHFQIPTEFGELEDIFSCDFPWFDELSNPLC